jgi:hypothetical protein
LAAYLCLNPSKALFKRIAEVLILFLINNYILGWMRNKLMVIGSQSVFEMQMIRMNIVRGIITLDKSIRFFLNIKKSILTLVA